MEAEVLQNLGRALPDELKSALPLELRDALAGGTGPAVISSQPGASSTPPSVQEPVGKSSLVDYQTGAAWDSLCYLLAGYTGPQPVFLSLSPEVLFQDTDVLP